MTGWIASLWRAVWHNAGAENDGYGQSWRDDIRSALRFRALAKRQLSWRSPEDWPGDILAEFPLLDRFGDGVIAYWREGDEDWFVVDRIWHGWPDPPEFAFFAFDAQKRVVTGHDFGVWPAAWTNPQSATA